ncbi:bifunctional phosphopantothenoylcysteine decarboxylase/phosphopantothenate--cysteine ligase CoaBC [Lutimonas sp.]|uniref:bifunctional phosphopantothenoylcysteine decarboxylase/phosphopantothenate--cysteine ligase CoaBC n=1 Tax=Lutimonas sp. TaxID=1872403 RepID=UPI003C716F09
MSVLSGKKILLGITAGIAAYKTSYLVRHFVKAGAEVKVVMTPAAKDFVTPLTLSTLSKNPVQSTFYDKSEENELWNNHVDLALWADLMVIAPLTANTLAKMSEGICDNLLLATYLSAKSTVYFAPAMDLDMYQHETTASNISSLEKRGNVFIPPSFGELASGLEGEGRMAEPEEILTFIENHLLESLPLRGKRVLITAGPTYEAIDPVRFIGNHSSGKMGFALAEEAAGLGASVTLISGPSHEKLEKANIHRINVVSAEQMYQSTHQHIDGMDIAIFSAAVSDFTPKVVSSQKIKKKESNVQIELVPTKDILASVGAIKKEQYLVGFALETENELENARDKIKRKNLDLIVLNSLQDKGAGFRSDTNKVTLIDKMGKVQEFELKSKKEVATDIFIEILKGIHA